MILTRANTFRGPLEGVGHENQGSKKRQKTKREGGPEQNTVTEKQNGPIPTKSIGVWECESIWDGLSPGNPVKAELFLQQEKVKKTALFCVVS